VPRLTEPEQDNSHGSSDLNVVTRSNVTKEVYVVIAYRATFPEQG
jgi:hypothetical protein